MRNQFHNRFDPKKLPSKLPKTQSNPNPNNPKLLRAYKNLNNPKLDACKAKACKRQLNQIKLTNLKRQVLFSKIKGLKTVLSSQKLRPAKAKNGFQSKTAKFQRVNDKSKDTLKKSFLVTFRKAKQKICVPNAFTRKPQTGSRLRVQQINTLKDTLKAANLRMRKQIASLEHQNNALRLQNAKHVSYARKLEKTIANLMESISEYHSKLRQAGLTEHRMNRITTKKTTPAKGVNRDLNRSKSSHQTGGAAKLKHSTKSESCKQITSSNSDVKASQKVGTVCPTSRDNKQTPLENCSSRVENTLHVTDENHTSQEVNFESFGRSRQQETDALSRVKPRVEPVYNINIYEHCRRKDSFVQKYKKTLSNTEIFNLSGTESFNQFHLEYRLKDSDLDRTLDSLKRGTLANSLAQKLKFITKRNRRANPSKVKHKFFGKARTGRIKPRIKKIIKRSKQQLQDQSRSPSTSTLKNHFWNRHHKTCGIREDSGSLSGEKSAANDLLNAKLSSMVRHFQNFENRLKNYKRSNGDTGQRCEPIVLPSRPIRFPKSPATHDAGKLYKVDKIIPLKLTSPHNADGHVKNFDLGITDHRKTMGYLVSKHRPSRKSSDASRESDASYKRLLQKRVHTVDLAVERDRYDANFCGTKRQHEKSQPARAVSGFTELHAKSVRGSVNLASVDPTETENLAIAAQLDRLLQPKRKTPRKAHRVDIDTNQSVRRTRFAKLVGGSSDSLSLTASMTSKSIRV